MTARLPSRFTPEITSAAVDSLSNGVTIGLLIPWAFHDRIGGLAQRGVLSGQFEGTPARTSTGCRRPCMRNLPRRGRLAVRSRDGLPSKPGPVDGINGCPWPADTTVARPTAMSQPFG